MILKRHDLLAVLSRLPFVLARPLSRPPFGESAFTQLSYVSTDLLIDVIAAELVKMSPVYVLIRAELSSMD